MPYCVICDTKISKILRKVRKLPDKFCRLCIWILELNIKQHYPASERSNKRHTGGPY